MSRTSGGDARTRRTARTACAATALALFVLGARAPEARAQEPAERGLTLDEVLAATLEHNPELRLARQRVEAARGALLAAATPFDTQLEFGTDAGRAHELLDGGPSVRQTLSYSLTAPRVFRSGLWVAPEITHVRTDFTTLPSALTDNSAEVALTVGVPLLRDRGGAVTASAERAAEHDHEAEVLSARHTAAERALLAAEAYWDYLAAEQRLEAYLASEERAQVIADQTRVLVEADERTAADLTQTLGNLAAKRVTRIAAEQAVVDARQRLGLAMGLSASGIVALPPPTTAFPEAAPEGAAGAKAGSLIDSALALRADLLAAERGLRAVETRVEGARSEMRPRLDLSVRTGYSSSRSGLGVGDFFSPLVRDGRGLDASFQLRFSLPLANSLARGRLLQNAAAQEQRRVVRDDLRRRIASGVLVAGEALRRGEEGMRDSAEAVRLLEATVHAAQRKFQLGMATLFDVIQAEDALTSAVLGQIQSRRGHASAIAALRFQTGTLVTASPDGAVRADAARLGTAP